jgi:hypothetical protein
VKVAYPQDEDKFFSEAFGGMPEVTAPAEGRATPLPIAQLLDSARAHWHGRGSGRLHRVQPGGGQCGDRHPPTRRQAPVHRHPGRALQHGQRHAAGETPPSGGATATRGVLYGLHLARFADWGLRALFFLSGLVGCLMVASGVVLWAVKERPRHAKSGRTGFGLRLVDALNIGTVAGLPIAFAAYFWGNRLLPLDIAERSGGGQRVLLRLGRRCWPPSSGRSG